MSENILCPVCNTPLPAENFDWVVNRCYRVRGSVCRPCVGKMSVDDRNRYNDAEIVRAREITGNSRLGRFDDVVSRSKLVQPYKKRTR